MFDLILTGSLLRKKIRTGQELNQGDFFRGCCIIQRKKYRSLDRVVKIEKLDGIYYRCIFKVESTKFSDGLNDTKGVFLFLFLFFPKTIRKEE